MSKVANTVRESVRDKNYKEEFHSLDFFCDWGSASEYAEAAVKSSLLQTPEDFVVASGEYVHALDLISVAFDAFGLNYENHIIARTSGDGEGVNVPTIDNSKLISLIPNVIKASAHQVLEEMISKKLWQS
jgi:GDP-D-mannose dehydratase